jgi:uncharacterized protein YqgC (DUF456 family)
MKNNFLRIIRIIAGAVLLVIGVSGIFLPILPGWLLIFVGIELLGFHLVFLDQIKEYVKEQLGQSKKSK